MAKPTAELVQAIRDTADKIEAGANYMWGHMGSCNCGHLAQTITNLSNAEIHNYALQRSGDWFEQTQEYCATSGYPIDLVIDAMLEKGLSLQDLQSLERLNNREVLARIPAQRRPLRHNVRPDVVLYMRTWADHLAEQLPAKAGAAPESTPAEAEAEAVPASPLV
jgi:hypothetical protein